MAKPIADPRQQDIQTLAEKIKDIDVAMLTTVDETGTLHSRPMSTQQVEFDGDLWFFSGLNSGKTAEIRHDAQVNVAYADPKVQRYISVAGTAQIVRDRAKMKELWNPLYKAWFPKGLDDPELSLLKVTVKSAEYWEMPGGALVQLTGFVKALVTGQAHEGGENERIDLAHR
jgi:general stress protein 26